MIDQDVILGAGVKIYAPDLVNLYGCRIGDGTAISPFVEITRGAVVGAHCSIATHAYICDAVTIEDHVFIGHGVMFTNDLYPHSETRVKYLPTLVRSHARIGSNATVIGGVTIGEYAVVGAGAVVTKDVPPLCISLGNPARITRRFDSPEDMLAYARQRQALAESP